MSTRDETRDEEENPFIGLNLFKENEIHYFPERDLKRGPSAAKTGKYSRPDYVIASDRFVIIGEIKTGKEPPRSTSWRRPRSSDSELFKRVRNDVAAREKEGSLSRDVGGHEIIIAGQIPDYALKLGKTFQFPGLEGSTKRVVVYGAYTFPVEEKSHVDEAFRNRDMKILATLRHHDFITYLYKLSPEG